MGGSCSEDANPSTGPVELANVAGEKGPFGVNAISWTAPEPSRYSRRLREAQLARRCHGRYQPDMVYDWQNDG